ncbi:hypothetical protein N7492_007535 [Penicillium capsulatum]|uniref:Alpha/beta hydrolase fold-3 domain-containing protein n=1 Tax=Penicillium capsulatum TaxID=69766 RepID=A0A9W9I004_9EURO|nr:hypothetical protein N7492_007535 [Penicillium capsulatum]KAJ6117369.1 hypothetical protein N7512_007094 [Penicillium capsulatum]
MAVPNDPTKLDGFDVIQAPYKSVGDHEIRTDIVVPQGTSNGKRPVILRFHGGGLAMGDSLFMYFWPRWLSDLALEKGAVVISPNYRLMPEGSSADSYDDIDDFWSWVHSPALTDLLAKHTTPTELDLTRIFTAGDSAGGMLSLYLALAHPTDIRAASASYPWMTPESELFTPEKVAQPFGVHIPEPVFEEMQSSVTLGTPMSSAGTQDRLNFLLGLMEYGKMAELYKQGAAAGPRERFYPMAKLEQPGAQIPRGGIVVLQGRHDSVVPLASVEPWVARAREVFSEDQISFAVRDGEHEFDESIHYEEPWLREVLQKHVEAWLA